MIAALFVRKTSHYKKMAGVDCYDIDRDARTFAGGVPGVYHPPCRSWGKLSHFAKPRKDERELAIWSMDMVRKHGGVLEHPYTSKLWQAANCIGFGMRDQYGGVLVPVYQSWWGHKAPKQTCLYFVGPVPEIPDEKPPTMIQSVENMSAASRETTPINLAIFLVQYAQRCAGVLQ